MISFYLSLIETEADKSLFERVYEAHRQNMFKYAMKFLHDEGNAEDVVHEVFLAIVKSGVGKIRGVDEEGNLWVYLATAVRNQCITFMKKQRNVQLIEPGVNEFFGSLHTGDSTAQDASYASLVRTIRELDPIYADVLYYDLVQEMPSDTIANLLGLKPATVRKRISRGKELLREKLGKDYFA